MDLAEKAWPACPSTSCETSSRLQMDRVPHRILPCTVNRIGRMVEFRLISLRWAPSFACVPSPVKADDGQRMMTRIDVCCGDRRGLAGLRGKVRDETVREQPCSGAIHCQHGRGGGERARQEDEQGHAVKRLESQHTAGGTSERYPGSQRRRSLAESKTSRDVTRRRLGRVPLGGAARWNRSKLQ